jgi:hypothetical protein
MTEDRDAKLIPPAEQRRPAPNVVDQRQQQIDPAGRHRVDLNENAKHSRKQPGGAEIPEDK